MEHSAARRKDSDAVAIAGDYQHRAITEGPAVQRFWHHSKLLAIRALLPPAPDDRILDVGCGSGVVSSILAASGARVTGIDSNPRAVAYASRRFSRANLDFVEGRVDDALPVTEVSVDKIYCLEVIEHVYRSQAGRMLDLFRRQLKPRGRVLLTTPNYRSPWPAIEWAMDRSRRFPVMAEEQHVERYHARRLAALCAERGFEVHRLTSICLLAPWIAPLGWRLAERLFDLEVRLPVRLGSVLVAVIGKALG